MAALQAGAEGPSEFDVARKRAEQQANVAKQGQQDALKRRFAAMGNVNSGSFVKANQMVNEKAQEQLQQANEGINAQEQGEFRRRREMAEGREFSATEAEKNRLFSRAERLGGQDFSGQQAALQRAFATQERLGGQDFQGSLLGRQQDFARSEREAGQGFASGEREAQQKFAATQSELARKFQSEENLEARNLQRRMFDLDQQFKQAMADFEKTKFGKEMDFAYQQFLEDKSTTAFNRGMAEREAGRKGGIFNSIFGMDGSESNLEKGKKVLTGGVF